MIPVVLVITVALFVVFYIMCWFVADRIIDGVNQRMRDNEP